MGIEPQPFQVRRFSKPHCLQDRSSSKVTIRGRRVSRTLVPKDPSVFETVLVPQPVHLPETPGCINPIHAAFGSSGCRLVSYCCVSTGSSPLVSATNYAENRGPDPQACLRLPPYSKRVAGHPAFILQRVTRK